MYPNLKLEIFRQGMRQNHLAKDLGINEAVLSKIIRGFRAPSDAEKQMVAEYLHADVNWLFEEYNANGHAASSRSGEHALAEGAIRRES
jgi:transcriptional regulator with XRE-family HTH domain